MKIRPKVGLRRLFPLLMAYGASSGSLVLANAAQLVTFAILARAFGAAEFGRYVSFFAVTSIGVHLCGLGASESLVRRVPQDPTAYPDILGHNLILDFLSGGALIALGMAVMPSWMPLSDDPRTNAVATFLLIATNVLLVRLAMLPETIYLGHSRLAAANGSVVGFAVFRTLTAVIACGVFGVNTVVDWAAWQFASHLLLVLIYGALALRLGRPRAVILPEEIPLGILFATPFIFRALRQNADLLILGAVADAEIVASYGVARRISDSSYLAIDALNRLLYPRLAVASLEGIHRAIELTRQILGVALALGFFTALGIFLTAPYLPKIFGPEYVSLPHFCRIMAWAVVLCAGWSVAVDLLGAAGKHGPRAWILNLSNGLGAVAVGAAAYFWPPNGVFVANYAIDLSILVGAWASLLNLTRRSRREAQA